MRKRHLVQLSAIGLLALLLALGLAEPIGSQRTAQAAARQGVTAPQEGTRTLRMSSNLKVSVDGSVSPSQVPDEIAYRLYLKMLAQPGESNALVVRRRNAFLGRLQLSPQDLAAVNNGLADLGDTLGRLDDERRTAANDDTSQTLAKLQDLKSREQAELDAATSTMRERLTRDGLEKFDSHIRDHVKTRIVIYDSPDAAHSRH